MSFSSSLDSAPIVSILFPILHENEKKVVSEATEVILTKIQFYTFWINILFFFSLLLFKIQYAMVAFVLFCLFSEEREVDLWTFSTEQKSYQRMKS